MENKLANFFNKTREVVDAAQTPFARLSVFVLPIISPLVPASFTGLHIYKLMMDIFSFSTEIAVILSVIVSLVLELIGFAGAIEFIHSIYQLVRNKDDYGYWLPVFLTGFSYLFYLGAMFAINVQLSIYFETPKIMANIIGLLSFVTVPSGMLIANHIGRREENEKENQIRHENNDFRLKKAALKAGINVFAQQSTQFEQNASQLKSPNASSYRNEILSALNKAYTEKGTVLRVVEITNKFKLDYNKSKGYVSSLRSEWMQQNGIENK